MDDLESWIRETYSPIVLTCASPEAERICQKNGLSCSDLLNGYSYFHQLDTPIRSVSQTIQLRQFNYQFISSTQFGTVPISEATTALDNVLHQSTLYTNEKFLHFNLPSVKTINDVPEFIQMIQSNVIENHTNSMKKKINSREIIPWHHEFSTTLMDTFRCEEYSMMYQPAAILLIISSTDENPRRCFEELGASQNLPPVFLQGVYDPILSKYFLVLHDEQETKGTNIDPDGILNILDIPSNVGTVLRINSIPPVIDLLSEDIPGKNPSKENIWEYNRSIRPPLFPENVLYANTMISSVRGGLLSSTNLNHIEAFVRDFCIQFVIPSLESRIYSLNEIVTSMKKGVKNVFKSWLRRPKEITQRPSSGNSVERSNARDSALFNGQAEAHVTYRCDSIEAQTRLLADTAFMIYDYELALQMYRLVRDDYKSDKSTFHTANTNEMIALCLMFTKGSPNQVSNALDGAVTLYGKSYSNVLIQRLSVRSAVLAAQIYTSLSFSGLYTDYMDQASAALIRGSASETGICSAVLMEQAAFCDLRCRNPKFRKYGFRIVMAGHVYENIGHLAHAARCYTLARVIYTDSKWAQVEDHINFTLAQHANRLNEPLASIALFLQLIATGHNSASQQESLLYEFSTLVKQFLSLYDYNGCESSGGRRTSDALLKNIQSKFFIQVQTHKLQDGQTKKVLCIKDLHLPEVDDASTIAFSSRNAIAGIQEDVDGAPQDSEPWKSLEECLKRESRIHQAMVSTNVISKSSSNTWLTQVPGFHTTYRGKHVNAELEIAEYAVGEPIYVEFTMKNALSCAVDVEQIHVFGKFTTHSNANQDESVDIPTTATFDNLTPYVEIPSISLQLLPCSEARLRLSVCPNTPGSLHIFGVRWQLFGGDVLGEHTFSLQGKLLQDTRMHRELRTRQPNTILRGKIVGPMPWLGIEVSFPSSCTLSDQSYEWLKDEIVEATMTLENRGTSPLTNLELCCQDLFFCAPNNQSSNDNENVSMASYIGATAHVLDWRHLVLSPGQTKTLKLYVKKTVVGQTKVHMLARYSRELTEGANGEDVHREKPRTVRLQWMVNVLPSLKLSSNLMYSPIVSGEYLLCLRVTNSRELHIDNSNPDHLNAAMIKLKSVVLVSDKWNIEHIHALKAHMQVDPISIGEVTILYFRIFPRSEQTQPSEQALISNNTIVLTSEYSIATLPLVKFLCVENAKSLVANKEKLRQIGYASQGTNGGDSVIRNQNTGLRSIQSVRRENQGKAIEKDSSVVENLPPQPSTYEALFWPKESNCIHLTMLWSTTRNTNNSNLQECAGQSNILSLPLVVSSASSPLTATLEYDDLVYINTLIDNQIQQFVEVDIKIVIRNENQHGTAPIDFTLELLDGKVDTSKSSNFFWSGITSKRVTALQAGSAAAFQAQACFLTAGMYDLNQFRCVINNPQQLPSFQGTQTEKSQYVHFSEEYLIYVANGIKPSVKLNSFGTDSTQTVDASNIKGVLPLSLNNSFENPVPFDAFQ